MQQVSPEFTITPSPNTDEQRRIDSHQRTDMVQEIMQRYRNVQEEMDGPDQNLLNDVHSEEIELGESVHREQGANMLNPTCLM